MDRHIQAKLAALQGESPVLIALYDRTDRLRYANPAFRAAFALAATDGPLWEEIMRRNLGSAGGTVVQSPDFEAWLASTKSRRGKQPYRAFEMDQADGRWFWMTETVDADGWMLCLATDITHLRVGDRELRQARDVAVRASQTDDLTGVASRSAMMRALEDISEAMTRGAVGRACVCLFDLDLFKRVNDSFGHQVGDRILVAFARLVQQAIRRHDRFGRVGGEEFMLILPETELAAALRVVNSILADVRQARLIAELPGLVCTSSAGVAAILPGQTAKEIYARADRALYHAKDAGRDRLESAA
ncbi:GGDEF domain-containing protein [Acidisoma sp. 7E03]